MPTWAPRFKRLREFHRRVEAGGDHLPMLAARVLVQPFVDAGDVGTAVQHRAVEPVGCGAYRRQFPIGEMGGKDQRRFAVIRAAAGSARGCSGAISMRAGRSGWSRS